METCTVNNVSKSDNWDCVSLVRQAGGTVDLTVTDPDFRGTFRDGDDVNVEVEGNGVRFLGRGKTAARKAEEKAAREKADAELRAQAEREAAAAAEKARVAAEKAYLESPEYKAIQDEAELTRLRALKDEKDRAGEIKRLKKELGE